MQKSTLVELPLFALNVTGQHPDKQNLFAKIRFTILSIATAFANTLIIIFLLMNITNLEIMGDALGNFPLLYQV